MTFTELRKSKRYYLPCPCNCLVNNAIFASMYDVSEFGTRLYLGQASIEDGQVLHMEIDTPLGNSSIQGIVKWAKEFEHSLQVGISFYLFDGYDQQPLHKMLQSMAS